MVSLNKDTGESKYNKRKSSFGSHLLLSSDLKNPEIVTLRNLTKDSAGVYKCTASNDVGEESCTVEVKMHCKWRRFLFLFHGAVNAAGLTADSPHLLLVLQM